MEQDAKDANQLPANTAMEQDANTANQIPANTAMVQDANTAQSIAIVPLMILTAITVALNIPQKVARIAAPNIALKVAQTMTTALTLQRIMAAASHHRKPTQELPTGARETRLAVMKNAQEDTISEIDKAFDHY